jgi:hypothetical protein
MAHQEISPVIPLGSVVDNFLWTYDIARRRQSPSPISSGENQYASVTVVLIALSLEGYLSRVLYLLDQNHPKTQDASPYPDMFNLSAEEKLESILGASSDPEVVSDVDELMAVRNSLAHSHIYETERDQKRNKFKTKQQIARIDRRWRRCVDPQKFCTKKNSLNVVPSEVNYSDAIAALEIWGEVSRLLTNHIGHCAYLPPHYPTHYQIDPSLTELIDEAHSLNSPSLHGYVKYGRHFPVPTARP